MKLDTPDDVARYHRLVGKVVYKKSNKPFKSGAHMVRVESVVTHPITQRAAFTFVDSEGIVECRTCKLHVDNPDRYFGHWADMLEAGVPVLHVQSEISRHLTALHAQPENTPDRDDAIAACVQFEGDLNRMIQQTAEGCVLTKDGSTK